MINYTIASGKDKNKQDRTQSNYDQNNNQQQS